MHPFSSFRLLLVILGLVCISQRTNAQDSLLLSDSFRSPTISITADAIFLSHSGSSFRSEILEPGSGSVTVSQDLEHGFPVAPRVRAEVQLLDSFYVEGVYFGTSDWNSNAQLQNVPPLPDLSADIAYSAEMQNIELNCRRATSFFDISWLVGVRYLNYQDSFLENYRLTSAFSPVITETASGAADNVLLGPQIGLLQDIGLGRTQISLGGKLGFMNNRVDQFGPAYTSAITIDGNPETVFVNENDDFALLGELSATLSRHVTPNLSFRSGYQGIFMDSVVQSATQNGSLASPGTLWVHGLLFGVELRH
ncbi:MAG: BBP7 family outer membrane beta-barrel protein [Planctomycetota bacterium]